MFGPDFIAKLAMNPETRGYLEQPDFQKIIQDLGSNPGNLAKHFGDPRFQKAMEVGMGLSLGMGGGMGGMGGDMPDMPDSGAGGMDTGTSSMNSEPRSSRPPAPKPTPVVEVEMSEEEKEAAAAKQKALEVLCPSAFLITCFCLYTSP